MDAQTTDDARYGLGGNNPPDPIEILRAELSETHSELIKRCAVLLDLTNRLPAVMDDEWEAKISEAIKSCTKFSRNSEVTRLDANEPHRALIAATDAFFKNMSDKVDDLKTRLSKEFLTPYQQEKADRLKREREEAARIAKAKANEEARIAREEAARVAEAKRREEAAKAEAERIKRERIEADERRQAEAKREAERQAAAKAEAERLEAEARNKKQRAAAGKAIEAAEKEAAETAARLKREADEAKEKDRREKAEAKAEIDRAAADRREQQRKAGEARDRSAAATQAQNVTTRAAKASTADLSRTRTDLGAVASLRTTWTHDVTDHAAVPRLYLRVDESAITAAIKAATVDGKCTLKIDGVHIYPVSDSVVR